jgi:Kef-type K+ transport system membrane component KefB
VRIRSPYGGGDRVVTSENILLELFIIFAAAKVAGELFRRLGQPPVIGELLVGVLLGARALGVIHDSEVHRVLQELGAVVLLFMIGLDTKPGDIRRVGVRSFAVGASGILLPFACGWLFILATGRSSDEALFVGAAMVATSVGITARVLADLGVVHEIESRIILGAAVIDDILGLLVLAIVGGLARGDLSPLHVATLGIGSIVFVAIVGFYGHRAVEVAAPRIENSETHRGTLILALAICLGLSGLADTIGLAAIIGAFLAGMAFSERAGEWQLEEQVEPVYQLLVPFFFVVTGSQVDPATFADPGTLGLLAVITGLAILGKSLGCGLAAWGMERRSMAIIGAGMVPRGEVGIIVASVGLATEMITQRLYGVIVAMSIITTLIAPPALKVLFAPRVHAREVSRARRTGEVEGIGG